MSSEAAQSSTHKKMITKGEKSSMAKATVTSIRYENKLFPFIPRTITSLRDELVAKIRVTSLMVCQTYSNQMFPSVIKNE